jgi:hypothetical protein
MRTTLHVTGACSGWSGTSTWKSSGDDLVACYPSDAHRRPLQPAGGWLALGGRRIATVAESDRLEARTTATDNDVTCTVDLGGRTASMSADVSAPPP